MLVFLPTFKLQRKLEMSVIPTILLLHLNQRLLHLNQRNQQNQQNHQKYVLEAVAIRTMPMTNFAMMITIIVGVNGTEEVVADQKLNMIFAKNVNVKIPIPNLKVKLREKHKVCKSFGLFFQGLLGLSNRILILVLVWVYFVSFISHLFRPNHPLFICIYQTSSILRIGVPIVRFINSFMVFFGNYDNKFESLFKQ